MNNISANSVLDSNKSLDQVRDKIGRGFSDKAEDESPKKELGKDDFMKLMSVQLQYQDPVNPLKSEEMAAQLAQFSSLEQMVNVNKTLEKMSKEGKPRDNVQAAALIGKEVLTDSTKFELDDNRKVDLKFHLADKISSGKLTIVDEKGEIVREMELEKLDAGAQTVQWNGVKTDGQQATLGNYSIRVNAADENGKNVEVSTKVSGVVSGVEFENGSPVLLIGDKKVFMNEVRKIVDPAVKIAAEKSAQMANAVPLNSKNPVVNNEANKADKPNIGITNPTDLKMSPTQIRKTTNPDPLTALQGMIGQTNAANSSKLRNDSNLANMNHDSPMNASPLASMVSTKMQKSEKSATKLDPMVLAAKQNEKTNKSEQEKDSRSIINSKQQVAKKDSETNEPDLISDMSGMNLWNPNR